MLFDLPTINIINEKSSKKINIKKIETDLFNLNHYKNYKTI